MEVIRKRKYRLESLHGLLKGNMDPNGEGIRSMRQI